MSDPIREQWVAAAAPGKTFAEVGGLWGTVNEQVTVAARAGATSTTMIDLSSVDAEGEHDLWAQFKQRAAALGVTDTTCVQGSIDDVAVVEQVGAFDVVCCSGVLYHCPDPLLTLCHLRRITRETLVLGTVSIPPTISGLAGAISLEQGAALFVPAMNDAQRAIVGEWLSGVGDVAAIGLTHPIGSGWSLDDYAAWWWLFTRDFVAKLLYVAGFDVDRIQSTWGGRATLFLARSRAADPGERNG